MDILNLIFRASTKELADAERQLDRVEDKTNKVQRGAGKVEQAFGKLSSVGGPIGDVASKMDNLKGSVDDVFSASRLLGPAFIAAVGAAGVLAAIRFAGVLDDLGDLAAKLGLSTTQTLLLKQEMDDAGISVDSYQKALDRAAKALAKADDEGKAAAEAMKTLGINTKERQPRRSCSTSSAMSTAKS